MVSPVTVPVLPVWVSATQAFQNNVLLSKTALEVAGLDTTMYAMGRGPVEKREIAFKCGITTAMAGFLAPLHAGLFARAAAHFNQQIDHRRLCLTYNELQSVEHMTEGLKRLEKEVIANGKPLLALPAQLAKHPETLRIKTLNAKTTLLALDLATESLFLLNVGWFKNWFTYKMTGKKQFAGEMGSVNAQDLDRLYDHKAALAKPPVIKPEVARQLLNVSTVITSVAMAAGLRRAFIQPEDKHWALSRIRQVGHLFNNHSKGFTLGIAPYAAAFVFLNFGEYSAARSDNERLEVLIKKTPLFLTFMFGDHLLNQAFSKVLPPQGYEVKETITETLRHAPDALKVKAASRAAVSYGLAFALQTALVAGVIYTTNKITRRRVKTQVADMKQAQGLPLSTTPSAKTAALKPVVTLTAAPTMVQPIMPWVEPALRTGPLAAVPLPIEPNNLLTTEPAPFVTSPVKEPITTVFAQGLH